MKESERFFPPAELLPGFLAIAETGNLTRAAERIGRTQSALSVQLRKLESYLGVRLFEREPRGMRLSSAGETLLPVARAAQRELGRIGALFNESIVGCLRIGVPDDYGPGLLETILADFAQCHPGIEVTVRCGFSADFPNAVREGTLDLAIHVAEESSGEGELLELQSTPWVAREDWSIPVGEPLPLALFDRSCWWREAALAAIEGSGRSYRVAYSSESSSGVKAAIKAGLAVGALAETSIEPGMKVLGEAEGFPTLPRSAIVLLRSADLVSAGVEPMAEALRQGLVRQRRRL